MGIYKKIAFGILGLLIILFVAAASIAPRVINSASVKEKIITTASQQLDGDVTFQKITVSLFPRPHAELHLITAAVDLGAHHLVDEKREPEGRDGPDHVQDLHGFATPSTAAPTA